MGSLYCRCLYCILFAAIISFPTSQWALIQLSRQTLGFNHLLSDLFQAHEHSIWATLNPESNQTFRATSPNIITSLSDLSTISLSHPFIIRGLSKDTVLSISDMTDDAVLKDVEIDYFSDARKQNTVPDSKGKLGEVVQMIYSGGVQKFGTQKIIHAAPHLIKRLVKANDWLETVFGKWRVGLWQGVGSHWLSNLIVTGEERRQQCERSWTARIIYKRRRSLFTPQPPPTCASLPIFAVPVFMARGQANSNDLGQTTRTDLHCEPIANMVYQTEGEKVWTLVDPVYSHLLNPTLAPDGRAYFYSMLDALDSNSMNHVPRYEIKTIAGDIMYVPSWTWHRVEYLPDVTAVSVSLFEFAPREFVFNNPLYAATLIPNLIKEAVGLKTQ